MKTKTTHPLSERIIYLSHSTIKHFKCGEAFRSMREIEPPPTIHHQIGSRILMINKKYR